jgi:type I site-specific restriction endonuclease
MTPEQKSRQHIDRQLEQAGWIVQDCAQMNISAGLGVAVREFPLTTGHADYMLYADSKAIGVVEAKPKGHTLTGVETQSENNLTDCQKNCHPIVFPSHSHTNQPVINIERHDVGTHKLQSVEKDLASWC